MVKITVIIILCCCRVVVVVVGCRNESNLLQCSVAPWSPPWLLTNSFKVGSRKSS